MTPSNVQSPPAAAQIDHGAAILWASAAILGALIILQAGRLPSGERAVAGDVTEVASLRLITVDVGNNEDALAVLNHGDETISIYGLENGRTLELYQVARLSDLFSEARRAATGGRR
jgi:hypothetical protein